MTFTQFEFMTAAQAVGVETALFKVCPDVMADMLLAAAKRHARFLEEAFPPVGHRKMLESVAKAAGFPHWHAFQSKLDAVATEFTAPVQGSRKTAPLELFKPFVPALPLLIQVGDDLAPTTGELAGLMTLRTKLAQELGDLPKIATALAKLNGADTWDALVTRRPENSTVPLYQFQVDAFDGSGRFKWSLACTQLVEELDALFQRYEERTKSARAKARRHVSALLKKRPDFLEGWLAHATMTELEGEDLAAGPLYEEGVKRARGLIPKGFKCQILWAETDNRPYHRLLCNQMRWQVRHGNLAAAIKLARLQLRQNPYDNLGIRIDLPLFLALADDRIAAIKAMGKLQQKDQYADSHILLVLALCSILLGDIKGSQVFFLRALFEFPALRPLLVRMQLPDLRDDQWVHGHIPDLESLWFHVEAVRLWRKDVEFEPMWLAILKKPEVICAERAVHGIYQDDRLALSAAATDAAEGLVSRHGDAWATALPTNR